MPTTHIPGGSGPARKSGGRDPDLGSTTRNEPAAAPFVVRDRTPPPDTTDAGAFDASHLEDPDHVDRFKVVRKLGEGGMGRVYEARDPELGRRVAVKLLAGAATTDARERLRREARAMAAVNSPHVAAVHEIGTHGNDVFVAMEYIEGENLNEWTSRLARPWPQVLAKYIQASKGLEAAHGCGLIHRDFKPDNVMVGRDGRVRVLDFGLAKSLEIERGHSAQTGSAHTDDALGSGAGTLNLTTTGTVMGTPRYMAPEQFRGEATDWRTDQFAFCVALYEGLFKMRPFAGNTMAALGTSVCMGRVRPIPESSTVPEPLKAAILRGLSVEPGDRHPSMRVLRGIMEDALEGKSTKAGARSLVPILLAGAAAVALAIVGAAVSQRGGAEAVDPGADPPAGTAGAGTVAPATTAPRPGAGSGAVQPAPGGRTGTNWDHDWHGDWKEGEGGEAEPAPAPVAPAPTVIYVPTPAPSAAPAAQPSPRPQPTSQPRQPPPLPPGAPPPPPGAPWPPPHGGPPPPR